MKHHLSTTNIHTAWDNTLPPQLKVEPGDTVTMQTLEATGGWVAHQTALDNNLEPTLGELIRSSADPQRTERLSGHALTGPILVHGAEPGDTLEIEILEVTPAAWGFVSCRPGFGLLHPDGMEFRMKFLDLRDPTGIGFAPGIRVPFAPFCGVMGVALAEPGAHSTIPPRNAGGNMDVRQLTVGSSLFLPVQVSGALFSAGDAHAAQGDGEVSGYGAECDATVTLRFQVHKNRSIRAPQIRTPARAAETGGCFITTAHEPDLLEAARNALRDMLDYLQLEHGLEREEAHMLSSLCVDLKISQAVDMPHYSISASLPLNIFS
jgi:acetamidase/formamidase